MSDSLQPHESQHARPPCPSPTAGVYPNPCPLSRLWHPTISSTVIPFSSCPQSFPASGCFPVSQLFTSGGQSTGASSLASVLPMNIQGSLRSPQNQELQTLFRSECPTTAPETAGFLCFTLSACSGGSFPPVFIGGTTRCGARHVCVGVWCMCMCECRVWGWWL